MTKHDKKLQERLIELREELRINRENLPRFIEEEEKKSLPPEYSEYKAKYEWGHFSEERAFDSLLEKWEAAHSEENDGKIPRDLSHLRENPIEAMLTYIYRGIVPPPEYLILFFEQFEKYFTFKEPTLEHAFFGRPIQRAGDYRTRADIASRNKGIHESFVQHVKEGKTRSEAAEIIANSEYVDLDADSIMRMMRGVDAADDLTNAQRKKRNQDIYADFVERYQKGESLIEAVDPRSSDKYSNLDMLSIVRIIYELNKNDRSDIGRSINRFLRPLFPEK